MIASAPIRASPTSCDEREYEQAVRGLNSLTTLFGQRIGNENENGGSRHAASD
jgi:hypothetical protein